MIRIIFFSSIVILAFGAVINLTPNLLNIPSVLSNNQSIEKNQATEAFTELVNSKKAKKTNSDITIKPKATKITARKLKSVNGEVSVLSIPVEITNSSSQTINMNLAHEWYGGIWAPTDFYVAVKLFDTEKKTVWEDLPAYQVGNLDENNKTVLHPGDSIIVDVRLNWRGTGSVPTEPLIDESIPNKHTIKFLLFFNGLIHRKLMKGLVLAWL